MTTPRGPGRNMALTPRERQVLDMTAEGLTAKEVARRLKISRKTVEQHRAKILRKLNVPNQAAAVGRLARDPDLFGVSRAIPEPDRAAPPRVSIDGDETRGERLT